MNSDDDRREGGFSLGFCFLCLGMTALATGLVITLILTTGSGTPIEKAPAFICPSFTDLSANNQQIDIPCGGLAPFGTCSDGGFSCSIKFFTGGSSLDGPAADLCKSTENPICDLDDGCTCDTTTFCTRRVVSATGTVTRALACIPAGA